MSDFFDKFIADLVKGASHHLRENGGVGVDILVDRENHGHEEKLAMDASTMLSGIPGMGPALGGLNAAARSGNMGHGFATGLGGGLGQAAGATAGSALGGLTDNDKLQMIATLLGSSGGGMLGASAGRHIGEAVSPESKQASALEQRYTDGVKSAAEALGIKEAFLPLLGSLLGGTALRAGASALARGAGGKMLGGLASKALPHMAGGIGGAATDMLGSMGGSALGSKLMPQRPQQPQGAVPPPPM